MGGIELLRRAIEAGLHVEARGNQLRVRGSRRHDALARELLRHKAELLPLLQARALYTGPGVDVDTNTDSPGEIDFVSMVPPVDSRDSALGRAITSPGDLPPDWRIEWEERAAIREYDGGQAREHAEAEALREIIERMRQAGGTSLSVGQPGRSERRHSSG